MIVPFALDPASLLMEGSDSGYRRATHVRLLDLWRKYGVLIYRDRRLHDAPLGMAVAQLPQDLRKRWQEAFVHFRKNGDDNPALDLGADRQREDFARLASLVQVICMEDLRARDLGLAREEDSISLGDYGPEVTRIDRIDRTTAFIRASELNEVSVCKDFSTDELWKQRFSLLASTVANVTLIDQFAMLEAIKNSQCGLKGLLDRLDRSERSHRLTVIAAFNRDTEPASLSECLGRMVNSLDGSGIEEVTLCLCEDWRFRGIAHYRLLRFGRTIVRLDPGIEVLAGRTVRRTSTVYLCLQDKAHLQDENNLRQVSRRYTIPRGALVES